jgi:hypothetical protein
MLGTDFVHCQNNFLICQILKELQPIFDNNLYIKNNNMVRQN